MDQTAILDISKDDIMKNIITKIQEKKIISVVEIDDLKTIDALCETLISSSINVIELALRTNVSKKAAELIVKNYPEITIGLGTVINIDQVKFALDVGADFAVSPGCNPEVIDYSLKNNLPFFPGISNPTDIEIAVNYGCTVLKFYPAEISGGIKFLETINSPFKYLNLKYIPLGGINNSNILDYLKSEIILAVGGSWINTKKAIKEKKWDLIKANALEINKLL